VASETLTATGLGAAAVEELARLRREPDWLRQFRLQALHAFEALPMPDQRTEGWRRTSLSGLQLDGHDVLTPPRVTIDAPEGVTVSDLRDVSESDFGKTVAVDADKFTALHYAFFNAGVVIRVPRNTVLHEPIWIRYEAGQAALIHTLLIADESSQVTLVEELSGAPGLASGVVEQVLGANANVRYVQLQRWAPETWSFSWQSAELAQDAHLRTLNVALGSRMARSNVRVSLQGRGGQADLLGVVGARGRQHVDFQTLQDHFGDATRSDLVIHNALRDRSSSNFTGLIRINKPAHQTESSQEQKNILLSPRSKADSDPKLEILNNDVVRCTHGASVGPIDPEMLFYLQSRGVDLETAERLIVDGFFQSVLGKLEQPTLQEAVWAAINNPEVFSDPDSDSA
jgi:Fe-S cluster assembly protein SufD